MGAIQGIEQNYPFLNLTGGPRKVAGGYNPQVGAVGGPTGVEAGIARINGEVTPDVGDTGTSYTNGLGHSKHTLRLMA